MNRFEVYIRDRHNEALNIRTDACGVLHTLMDNGEDITPVAVSKVAAAEAAANWWDRVIRLISDAGVDPVDALCRVREAAHHVLTDQASPRCAYPFDHAFAVASIEAARRFYHDTAHLDAITTRSAS